MEQKGGGGAAQPQHIRVRDHRMQDDGRTQASALQTGAAHYCPTAQPLPDYPCLTAA